MRSDVEIAGKAYQTTSVEITCTSSVR